MNTREDRKEFLKELSVFCHEVLTSRNPKDDQYKGFAKKVLRLMAEFKEE